MDWLSQNKYKNILIGVLIVLNLLTLTTIWMQTAAHHDTQPVAAENRAPESTDLIKQQLVFTEAQSAQYDRMRADERAQAARYNERSTELKTRLAEELFSPNPDSGRTNLNAREIGETQSVIEKLRFQHFKALLAICTPEQKEKLKPIIRQLFGRKPPREDAPGKKQPTDAAAAGEVRLESARGRASAAPPAEAEGRPGPPSVEEKVKKLSEKISLTPEQTRQINAVLTGIEKKKEELRQRPHPDQAEIEKEKERLRKEEDESIAKLLRSDQQREYEQMILHRRQ